MKHRALLLVFLVLGAFVAVSPKQAIAVSFCVEPPVVDSVTGNTEHRFWHDGCGSGFHFGTLLESPGGQLIFRPHPDRADPNGWGTSWIMNPFLAGAEPGLGGINSLMATDLGVDLSFSGLVAGSGGGTWSLAGSISYDALAQRVFGSGILDIRLLAALGADLNLERIASNFLHDVPLQTGGIGDTGDMRHAIVRYAPGGDPKDFIWYPPAQPAHFPQDFSNYLAIDVVGQLNTVDTLALGEGFQIAIARKPTVHLAYTSSGGFLGAGLIWDESQGKNFAADNVGINHLIPRSRAELSFDLGWRLDSTVIPEPSTGTLLALALAGLAICRQVRKRTG